jgi:hypothetical protein
MIRYLNLEEVLELHRLVLGQSRGLTGVRDLGGLDSALAQARQAEPPAAVRHARRIDWSGSARGTGEPPVPRAAGQPIP